MADSVYVLTLISYSNYFHILFYHLLLLLHEDSYYFIIATVLYILLLPQIYFRINITYATIGFRMTVYICNFPS